MLTQLLPTQAGEAGHGFAQQPAIRLWMPALGCPVCEVLCPQCLAESQHPAIPTSSCSFLERRWASVDGATWPTLLFKLPLVSLPGGHLGNFGALSFEAGGLQGLGSSLERLQKAWGLTLSSKRGGCLLHSVCVTLGQVT